MLHKIRAYVQQNNMLTDCRKVVVALSGGADSVCLLMVMKELQKEYSYELVAVHVNHCIRGKEADADEKFCVELCKNNDIKLNVVKEDVIALSKEWHMSVEEAGRKVRYDAFYKELGTKKGVIAVAHHMNDNAETVIFNVARGSNISGIVGIRAVNGNVIRPLLNVCRTEIEAFLKDRDQEYCIDSSNASNDYSRNIIRNLVMPELLKVNAASVENICALSEYMEKLEQYIDKNVNAAVQDIVTNSGKNRIINIKKLIKYDNLIQESVVYRVICDVAERKKDIERKHAEYLLELCSATSGKQIDLPYGITAKKEYEFIYVGKSFEEAVCDWELFYFAENSEKDEFLYSVSEKYPQKKVCTIEIDYDRIKVGLVLRSRQEGDYITIDKSGKHKTVKKFFIDERIPQSRRNIPIVFDGDEAVWIVGKRLNSRYSVNPDTSHIVTIVIVGNGFDD